MNPLHLALIAMMAQQACATLGRTTLPVVAPVALVDLALGPAFVGVFMSIAASAGILTTLGCGSFILRHGALRMTQVGMLSLGVGLAGCATELLTVFVVSALMIGFGTAVSTPSSSHLLSRYATPAQAPLVFSIKQTGVPIGLMIAGIAGPFLVQYVGWQGALLAMAGLSIAVAVVLQPTRARFDEDRRPDQPFALSDVPNTLRLVLRHPELRLMACAGFSFVGLQSVFSSFLVLFLVHAQRYDLATAGFVFANAMGFAIVARIGWGWLSGRLGSAKPVLAMLGFVMAGAAVMTALIEPHWPLAGVLAVAVIFSGTALSWHGVLLAEVARLAPAGRVGATTGGVLSFGDAASLVLPLGFGAALAITGGYRVGFLLAAVPPFLVASYLVLRTARTARRETRMTGE